LGGHHSDDICNSGSEFQSGRGTGKYRVQGVRRLAYGSRHTAKDRGSKIQVVRAMVEGGRLRVEGVRRTAQGTRQKMGGQRFKL
jgi:hypothetical protein